MDEVTQEDWLDRQLREAAPYIDDAGFTQRVLAQLPARRQPRELMRVIILIGVTLLASALAYAVSDGGRFITTQVVRLTTLPLLWIFALMLASGLLVMTGGLVAAVAKTTHDRF